jgi:F420-dependent oxidoreductase-like protein
MKLGLQINYFNWPGGPKRLSHDLAAVARTADGGGFDLIAVMDHFFQIRSLGPPELDMLEAYTTLGYLAAHTQRAKLLTVVTGAPYRYPAVLVKIVTTLDVLSGGRAMLGIGAAWNQDEARALGIPFPPVAERFDWLEDTLELAHRMWRDDETPFEGKRFRFERPLNRPQALSRPRPQIMIGGMGEQKTLRFVARYADACNLFPSPDLPRKLEVLKRHCEREKRDYDAIEKTCMFGMDVGERAENVGRILEHLGTLRKLGITTAIGGVKDVWKLEPLQIIARDVVPAIRDL